MRIGITYNIRKEDDATGVSEVSNMSAAKYLDENLMQNYPERIDDTYAEWDSMETIEAVRDALSSQGHETELIEADVNAYSRLAEAKHDFVFNIAEGHGGPSRESQIPSILELLDIPFTGSDSITTGICHDKSRCKEILSYYKIPNAPFFISDDTELAACAGVFPKFVKPLHEGSSKGIYNSSVVNSLQELRGEIERIKDCYGQPSIVEDYLPGREFTVAMLGNGPAVQVLPVIEINLDAVPEGFNRIYSYEVKWFFDTREAGLDIFRCPAVISEDLLAKIKENCVKAYCALRIRDWARIDVRLDADGIPNIVEVNPLPGILPDPADNSCYPKSARHAGMDYNAVINAVLREAAHRESKSSRL